MSGSDGRQHLIVVLGMHRSGTSAMTRGLGVAGVSLGDVLMPPEPGVNDKGFWEDLDIVRFNETLLMTCGRVWHSLARIGPQEADLLEAQGHVQAGIALLHRKAARHARFGFKDPRTAKLLPFWVRVFEQGAFAVRYVLALRNPASVVRSLARRDGFAAGKSYYLWADHLVTALSHLRGADSIVVDYDQLMEHPEGELTRVATWLGTKPDADDLAAYCHDFLDARLRHARCEPEDVDRDAEAPPLVRDMYRFLVDVVAGRVEAGDAIASGRIARWAEELARQQVLLRTIDDGERVAQQHQGEIRALRSAAAEREKATEDLARRIAESDRTVANLRQLVARRDKELEDLARRLAEQEGHIARLGESVADSAQGLQEILQSRSWRITKPLRWCGRTFRRLP